MNEKIFKDLLTTLPKKTKKDMLKIYKKYHKILSKPTQAEITMRDN